MGAVTSDSDTERLTANTDAAGSDRSSAVVDKPETNSCVATPTSSTAHRRRFATVAASVLLVFLLLLMSAGFCLWTMMRLSRIEARLERLERSGRHPVNYMVKPPHNDDHKLVRHHRVRSVISIHCDLD